ncbi:MAG: hypothetical protein LBK28_07040 [Propionibacteriaceae bacterium]|jgi:hypothetical protein|nr:hypothetical protein [Propionibacteriaceae bacterium]
MSSESALSATTVFPDYLLWGVYKTRRAARTAFTAIPRANPYIMLVEVGAGAGEMEPTGRRRYFRDEER